MEMDGANLVDDVEFPREVGDHFTTILGDQHGFTVADSRFSVDEDRWGDVEGHASLQLARIVLA